MSDKQCFKASVHRATEQGQSTSRRSYDYDVPPRPSFDNGCSASAILFARTVVCMQCAVREEWNEREGTPLYEANILPYSQHCHACGNSVVAGLTDKWPELFAKPAEELDDELRDRQVMNGSRQFTLTLDCDNDAFAHTRPVAEIARIMRLLASQLADTDVAYGREDRGNVRDVNGNTVGTWRYTVEIEGVRL